jgi:hypothetical protein
VNLKRLFHALVLSGTALGVAHCGGGMATEPGQGAGSSTTGGSTLLPDGGHAPTSPSMPTGPAGW